MNSYNRSTCRNKNNKTQACKSGRIGIASQKKLEDAQTTTCFPKVKLKSNKLWCIYRTSKHQSNCSTTNYCFPRNYLEQGIQNFLLNKWKACKKLVFFES